jgi:soluble lytic murein transglycosylase-like protein
MKRFALFLTLLIALPTAHAKNSTTVSTHHKKHVTVLRHNHTMHDKVHAKKSTRTHAIPETMADDKILRILTHYNVPVSDHKALIKAINASAAKHNIRKELIVAIIARESGFKRRAVSSRGARGLMQIMALHKVKRPFDIQTNVDKGAEILATYIESSKTLNAALARYGNSRIYVAQLRATLTALHKIS